MIPWLVEDVARGRNTYIYTLKGRYKKGSNRWCSMLYTSIMALKRSGTPAARARKLILIGDNFAENKNNTNLDFVADLVLNGVYDEVQMLYGPVGHTHNGIDAWHKTHNNDLGKFAAGTLAVLPTYLPHYHSYYSPATTHQLLPTSYYNFVSCAGVLQLLPSSFPQRGDPSRCRHHGLSVRLG